MIERPTAWSDGRPLGGLNGYPPEWHEWSRECEVRFVVLQMLEAPSANRKAVHEQWQKKFPHATPDAIRACWDDVVREKRKGAV